MDRQQLELNASEPGLLAATTEVQGVSVGVWVRVYKHVQVGNVLADSAGEGGEPGATRLWD